MTKRRTRRIALVGFAVLGVAAFACTFPEVTFAPEGVAEGGAGEGGGGTEDGGSTDAAPTFFADAFSELEAGVAKDDAGRIDASACPSGCDCDGDESKNQDAGCNPAGIVPDCDDHDTRARPGQVDYREDPQEPPLFGDWDCENGVQKKYPVKFDCTKVDLNSCPVARGFAAEPPCGVEADLLGCKIVTEGVIITTTTCKPDGTKTEKKKQACK